MTNRNVEGEYPICNSAWERNHLIACLVRQAAPPQEVIERAKAASGKRAMTPDAQKAIAKALVDLTARLAEPSPGYKDRIARRAIAEAEKVPGVPVDDELANVLSEASSTSREEGEEDDDEEYPAEGSATRMSQRSFCLGRERCKLIKLQCSDDVLEDGTGSCLWDAGVVLAEVLLARPQLVREKRVVELGAGIGLTSICAHLCWPKELRVTDGNAGALATCKANFRRNGLLGDDGQSIRIEQMDWEDIMAGAVGGAVEADVILAADVVYDPRAVHELVGAIASVLQGSEGSSFALVANAVRTEETLSHFLSESRRSSLVVEDVTDELFPAPEEGFHWARDFGERDLVCLLKISLQ